jgi:hypothetical protein
MEKVARGRGDGRQTWKRRKKKVEKVVDKKKLDKRIKQKIILMMEYVKLMKHYW